MSSSAKIVGTGATAISGSIDWSNPTRIQANDGSLAGASNTNKTNTYDTYWLYGKNCGFAIPAGATIDGIVVQVETNCFGGQGGSVWKCMRIRKADGSFGTTEKSTGATVTLTTLSFGGSTELWGETWTPDDINDVDFGAGLVMTVGKALTGDPCYVYVDHISITVYYTAPSGPANLGGINGLAKASVKVVNGLAIASVKTWDGLT